MRVLTFEDLVRIVEALHEAGYDNDGLVIGVPVPNREMMSRVNEDYHYRIGAEGDVDNEVNEVNINIGGVGFKYFVDERDFDI
mgnify:CR=1 FL=1